MKLLSQIALAAALGLVCLAPSPALAAEAPIATAQERTAPTGYMYVLVINDVGGRQVVTTASDSQTRVLQGVGDRALFKVPVNLTLTPGFDLAIRKTPGYSLPISGLLRLPSPRPGAFYTVKLSAFNSLIF